MEDHYESRLPVPNPHAEHMDIEAFREHGKAMIDWVADYWSGVEREAVVSRAKPGGVRGRLGERAPELGEDWSQIVRDLDDIVMPGITHWQHPRFFAFFSANTSGPAVLGDLASSGLGVQGMLWQTSPACTEVETRVLDWLAQMIGLPASFQHGDTEGVEGNGGGGGVIQGTASESTLTALVAARDGAIARLGARGEHSWSGRVAVYTSTQAHSSVVKAAQVCGIGREMVRLIEVDDDLAMDPACLERAILADLEIGIEPAFVCATLGTTSTGAMDPVGAVGEVVRRVAAHAWVHIDAAWAGSAFVCEELRVGMNEMEMVDSFVFNPHKWLLTNFDCSAFFVRGSERLDELLSSLSINPEYLRNEASASGAVVDYRDWHVPLGRRFRSLKLWFVIRHYGVEGLRRFIRDHVRAAEALERVARTDDRFEVVSRSLALVCLRVLPPAGCDAEEGDALTMRVMDRVNKSGEAYFTHTAVSVAGATRVVLRFNVGGTLTEAVHVREGWAAIQRALDAELGTDTGVGVG